MLHHELSQRNDLEGPPLNLADIQTARRTQAALAKMHKRELNSWTHGKERKNVYWVNELRLREIEEVSMIDKKQAESMATKLLKDIYVNRTYGSASIRTTAEGKILLYGCMYSTRVLPSSDLGKLQAIWRETVGQIKEPITRADARMDYSLKFEDPATQRQQGRKIAERILRLLPEPTKAAKYFNNRNMLNLVWLISRFKHANVPEAVESLTQYIKKLHTSGIIDKMDPYVVGLTLHVLKATCDPQTAEEYVNATVQREKQREKNRDTHKGSSATSRSTIFNMACDIYLENDNIEAAMQVWKSVINRSDSYRMLYKLMEYALDKRDAVLLQRVEHMYRVRKDATSYRNVDAADDEIQTGYMLYVVHRLIENKLSTIWMLPEVEQAIETRSNITYDFIRDAFVLPSDHVARQLGQHVLGNRIKSAQMGYLNNLELQDLLEAILHIQTSQHRKQFSDLLS